jgi:hypothetical protein
MHISNHLFVDQYHYTISRLDIELFIEFKALDWLTLLSIIQLDCVVCDEGCV